MDRLAAVALQTALQPYGDFEAYVTLLWVRCNGSERQLRKLRREWPDICKNSVLLTNLYRYGRRLGVFWAGKLSGSDGQTIRRNISVGVGFP